jgi:hypothetical protein
VELALRGPELILGGDPKDVMVTTVGQGVYHTSTVEANRVASPELSQPSRPGESWCSYHGHE